MPKSRQIHLTRRPRGLPTLDDFALVDALVPDAADGEVLVQAVIMSVDPYMVGDRGRGEGSLPCPCRKIGHGAQIALFRRGQPVEADAEETVVERGERGRVGQLDIGGGDRAGLRRIPGLLAPLDANIEPAGLAGGARRS